MAFSMNNGGAPGVSRRFRFGSTLSEINVVPLVDVVLVLLIIFMLTAHVMEFGLEVEVPQVRQVKDSARELPIISLTRDGRLFLNEQETNINEIGAAVERKFGKGQDVYVRADKDIVWDVMAQVISALGEAQIKVNLVTRPMDEADRPRHGAR